MNKLNNHDKNRIEQFIDSLYLDVQGTTTNNKLSEEYVIKLVTRFVISIGTAFWSITELLDFIRNRRNVKESTT